ncbi:Imm10 family immunity protein [Sorangium sp. So ce385]|uniref:Imm10 family immunity protein n=1 Tax=Sorangium sp. So ce385 TaxID=3133308 RepID=UPI003F5C9167
MRRFKAKALVAANDPDLNTYVVILTEQSDGGGMRLEIQKSLSSNEQDRQLGLDTYCLCTEESDARSGRLRTAIENFALEPMAANRASTSISCSWSATRARRRS